MKKLGLPRLGIEPISYLLGIGNEIIVPPSDTTPDAFTFTDVTNASTSTDYESNTITVTGIDASTPISITGGQYSKNGGAYTAASGTVLVNDTVKVKATSSGSASTAVNVVLTIGGVSDTYTVTTAAVFVAPRMTFGARIGADGDGLIAPGGGVGNGPNNFGQVLILALGGKLRPCTAPTMGQSGTRMQNANGSQTAWIPAARAALVKQRPNLWIAFSKGHNDGIMNLDPVGNSWYTDWEQETYADYQAFLTYATANDYFVAVGTITSDVAGESTWRSAVWAAQANYVASLTATDYRVRFLPVTSILPASSFSVDVASSYTHSDERMPSTLVPALLTLLSDVLPTQTIDDVYTAIRAGTYPGMGTANLDTLSAMATTGGAVSGTGLTIGGDGFLPGGKTATMTMVGPTAVAERISISGGRYKVRITLNGTVTTAGKIMFGDTSNIARTATPGRYFRHGIRARVSKSGYRNFGAEWGVMGSFAGGAGSLNVNNLTGTTAPAITDTIMWVLPQPTFGNDATFTAARRWAFYWPVGTVFSNDTVEFEEPFTYEGSDRGVVPAGYMGDASGVGGTPLPFFGNNYRARLTGTYSEGTGGTIRIETGMVQPEGLVNADFTRRCIYKGTSSDLAAGSGTLMYTYPTPAVWSAVLAAGLATGGQILYAEYDITDPTSGTVTTVRSRLTTDSLTVNP